MWKLDPAAVITAEQKEAQALTDAKSQLRSMLDEATRPILDAYPAAERLSWDAKEEEARTVLDGGNAEGASLLAGELAAQTGKAPTAKQLATRAGVVIEKADEWRRLVGTIAGLRQKFEAALDAAKDEDARRAVLAAAEKALAGL